MENVRTFNAFDTIKPEQKASKREERDYLDSFVNQAISKEPFLSFPRGGDTPMQLIQLLNALDQQGSKKIQSKGTSDVAVASDLSGIKGDSNSVKRNGHIARVSSSALAHAAAKVNGDTEKFLPGWPLMPPSKLPLKKCEKCFREFCSTINYRRHIRIHRRSLHIDKVYPKSKEHMHSFLDKLSLDEQKELLSFGNICLEEVSGSSIINALASVVQTSGFSSFPQVYVKAGADLLDIVQANPSRFPISSEELLNILDDASENTFLCAGNAVSLQKFVFDGEVGKVALDMKNVIACTSFLLEKELVKAWLADKDAEALRCQQLLMEEEEAAQKKQRQIMERKRKKKLRQKEHRFKENGAQNKAEIKVDASDSSDDALYCAESSSPRPPSDLEADTHDASFGSPSELLTSTESSVSLEEALDVCELESEDCDLSTNQPDQSDQREGADSHNPVMKSRKDSNGFQAVHNELKRCPYKELKNVSSMNSQMVWTRKTRPEWKRVLNSNEGEEVEQKSDQIDGSEVLIGSITVSLGIPNTECASEDCTTIEMPAKLDAVSNSEYHPSLKHWRPVSRQGAICSSMPPQSSIKEAETSGGLLNEDTSPKPERISLCRASVRRLFSIQAAEDFLAQRWKAALRSDHVEIVTSSSFDGSNGHQDDHVEEQVHSFDCSGRSILGNAENRMSVSNHRDRTTNNVNKPKFKPKFEKNHKVMYVPKHS